MTEPSGEDIAVRLDATGTDLEDPSAVAKQVPLASTLPSQIRVAVAATATRRDGVLRRFLGPRTVPVGRAERCTALLVRGYVGIGASDDAAWGRAP